RGQFIDDLTPRIIPRGLFLFKSPKILLTGMLLFGFLLATVTNTTPTNKHKAAIKKLALTKHTIAPMIQIKPINNLSIVLFTLFISIIFQSQNGTSRQLKRPIL
ncbi:hypothetical protein, partial [Heyndrickxia sporothermodurans]|uniref:hypothetical protein n=1 Tax=Heyndrickxia sporothermodurans TaxID=46224 RepID=UPI003635B7F5